MSKEAADHDVHNLKEPFSTPPRTEQQAFQNSPGRFKVLGFRVKGLGF